MIEFRVKLFSTLAFFFACINCAVCQTDAFPKELRIDTSFAFLQFYDRETGDRFVEHFNNAANDKVVIFHYGGSHIQAERPSTFARAALQKAFGNGGRGMVFNYGAANTYSSVNYTSTAKGNWVYAKSFQLPPKIPLGVCGMSVETSELNAELNFHFKKEIPLEDHRIVLFIENDSTTFGFDLKIDTTVFHFGRDELKRIGKHEIELSYRGKISDIQLRTTSRNGSTSFLRFYGLDIENQTNSGVVYHSLGVGAAAMRSVLYLDKMPRHAEVLKPDIVILDFGTNDILYTNSIDPKLPDQIRKAINNFRKVNPDVLIVLTSVQDLYKNGKYITAGPVFRDLIDTLAKEQKCMFWNWYDLSGGLRTIRTWHELGYAQSDCIHLTQEGYRVKGEFMYRSFLNTYLKVQNEGSMDELRVPMRIYDSDKSINTIISKDSSSADAVMTGGAIDQVPSDTLNALKKAELPKPKPVVEKKVVPKARTHKVKAGDTLSEIARRYNTTVSKLRKVNNLKSDLIRVGQVLKIPN
jgi:LysM repeat protein/lysophospholipase L1-like esterase